MKNQAFTLIELLVVVLIIGILAAIAVPQYRKAVDKSNTIQALTVLRTFVDAEEAYYLANGQYSNKLSNLDVNFPSLADWTYGAGFNREDPQVWIYNSKLKVSFNYYFHVKKMLCQTKKNKELCESFPVTKSDCYGEDLRDGWTCYYFN